jgi:hypothetical protein
MNWEKHFRNMKPARPRPSAPAVSFGAEAPRRKVGRMADLGVVTVGADMVPIGSPDTDDLQAIYTYVESQRAQIPRFPAIAAKITDFESWYEGLGYWNLNIMANDTLAEAIRRRDEINTMTGNVLPADSIPADKLIAPQGAASGLPGPVPPLIPPAYKTAAVVAGAATLVLVVLKKLAIL